MDREEKNQPPTDSSGPEGTPELAGWEAKTLDLPAAPGVYIFRDREGKALYVGKAKSLRARVRSYRRESGDERYHVQFLREKIAELEFIITDTEAEALILENNLIKKYRPRYNLKLRDDKTYYHLRLTLSEPFPRLLLARRPKKGGKDLLFGPFPSGAAVKETIRTLQEIFPLRRCPGARFQVRERACLNYQIGKCPGPCAGLQKPPDYGRMVDQVVRFLKGRRPEVLAELRAEMEAAAELLEFERAALLRDRIAALTKTLEPQKVDLVKPLDRDVIGYFREGDRVVIHRLGFRGGALLVSEPYRFVLVSLPDDEVLSSFLAQVYAAPSTPPEEILAPFPSADYELLAETFTKALGKKVSLRVPERGEGKRLVELAITNAEETWKRDQAKSDDRSRGLLELQARLRLAKLPRWMEGVDISVLGGENAVGSLVKFVEGGPDPAGYRRYRIQSVAGVNDYEMMREVLSRRFRRALAEGRPLPDLLLVDGGKGQLNVARAVLAELGIKDVELAALAKDRETGGPRSERRHKKGERVFRPGVKDPIALQPGTAAFQLLTRLRDEAHRFAVSYHQLLRGRKLRRSFLTQVPGIGQKKAALLLRHFGSLAKLRAASLPVIAAVPGLSPADAERVQAFLRETSPDET